MKSKLKVMAFEDGYDIEAILISGGIELTEVEFIQHWDTSKPWNKFVNSNQIFSYLISISHQKMV